MSKHTPGPVLTLEEFVRLHCKGQQYDSCHNTPCPHSTGSGCGHPLHPKNAAIAKAEAGK